MDYVELYLTVVPGEPWIDLIISDLGDIEFESFESNDTEVRAYIQEDKFDQASIDEVISSYEDNCHISSVVQKIETVNWNKEWEKNFSPIFVDDRIVVKSSFHEIPKSYDYEILIDPKMSFGTGHHATTFLIMQKMLGMDFKDKDVLDMGCGTAVLAILAKMMGANNVLAIDIDDWAYENSMENVELNHQKIEVKKGGAELLGDEQFNVILANINLNILLADMDSYNDVLLPGGDIIFSGVLEHDKEYLKEKAESIGLKFVEEKQRDKWMMFHFKKN